MYASTNGSIDLLSELPDVKVQPVLKRELDFEGFALLTMEHDFFQTALSTETFLEYVKEEELGMEKFQDRIGQNPEERERFARTLKCLIHVGTSTDGDVYKRVLGQKIEIVLLQNPYLLDPGDELEVQIFFEGKPLPDQLVMALNRNAEQSVSRSKAQTNADGIAQFTLNQAGLWLIRLVRLRPCAERFEGDCAEVDWESYWASFSFKLD